MLLPLLALCATACEEEDPPDEHGFIKVQFARSQAAADTPYIGTARIIMKMNYDGCFTNFYEMNPNYTQDGVDGAIAFGTVEDGGEGWMDRLCDPRDEGQAPCTVVAIDQELDVATHLTVEYQVEGNPENLFLKFGPLPLVSEIEEFTCESGAPRMTINAQDIRGVNAEGNEVWEGEALDDQAATPGQGKAVVLRAARTGG